MMVLTKLIQHSKFIIFNNYDLIATTGSIFAALDAGIIPESMPTTRQIITVVISMGTEIYTGKFARPLIMSVVIHTKNNPNAPPIKHNKEASIRSDDVNFRSPPVSGCLLIEDVQPCRLKVS